MHYALVDSIVGADRNHQAYVTGNAFVVLRSHDAILQTVYDGNETPLDAIAIDEVSGKIAICAGHVIRLYKPYGQVEDLLQVCLVTR